MHRAPSPPQLVLILCDRRICSTNSSEGGNNAPVSLVAGFADLRSTSFILRMDEAPVLTSISPSQTVHLAATARGVTWARRIELSPSAANLAFADFRRVAKALEADALLVSVRGPDGALVGSVALAGDRLLWDPK